eukprot:TRINITY_DN9507_c0_g1_i2.p1 TRINITY_DN9507_c0_g1~~TRINITY_DN9507_c0_g1_i2.p1  ORF type:complete len:614 (+),score=148.81 TRINITY_DN9507_c0_g1_i2:113-1954(+)
MQVERSEIIDKSTVVAEAYMYDNALQEKDAVIIELQKKLRYLEFESKQELTQALNQVEQERLKNDSLTLLVQQYRSNERNLVQLDEEIIRLREENVSLQRQLIAASKEVHEATELSRVKDALEAELAKIQDGAVEALLEKERELTDLREHHSRELQLLESDKTALHSKLLTSIASLEADLRASEQRNENLLAELESKRVESERNLERFHEGKASKSELIDELTKLDERLRESEANYEKLSRQLLAAEATHNQEISVLQQLLEETRTATREVNGEDREAVISRYQLQLAELRRASEEQIQLRNKVIETLEGELSSQQRRAGSLESETKRLAEANASLSMRLELVEKLKSDAEGRLEAAEAAFASKLDEALMAKGKLELELLAVHACEETPPRHQTLASSTFEGPYRPLSKELQELNVDFSGLRCTSPKMRMNFIEFDRLRADLEKTKEENEHLLNVLDEMEKSHREEIERCTTIERQRDELMLELKKIQESYHLEVANLQEQAMRVGQELLMREVAKAHVPLNAELESLRAENRSLQSLVEKNQHHLLEEIKFLREELRIAENVSLEAKLQFAQVANEKDFFKNQHKLLLAFVHSHNMKVDPRLELRHLPLRST